MTCPRCSSERLFQFEADKGLPAPVGNLPTVCRDCGLVLINGSPVQFPAELEAQVKSLAEASAAVGADAVKALERDPGLHIGRYFERVYRNGYLSGFWRALLFYRHNSREGRIKRLRELWKRLPYQHRMEADPATSKVYAEIDQLLALGDHHGPGPADEHPSETERSA